MDKIMADEPKVSPSDSGKPSVVAFSLSTWMKVAIMAALSLLLMLAIRVPIVPIAPFLTFDFAEVPALILAFALGPWAGAARSSFSPGGQGRRSPGSRSGTGPQVSGWPAPARTARSSRSQNYAPWLLSSAAAVCCALGTGFPAQHRLFRMFRQVVG